MRAADLMLFIEPMHRAGFDYRITGSIAGIIYGEPRYAHDLDELKKTIPIGFIALLRKMTGI